MVYSDKKTDEEGTKDPIDVEKIWDLKLRGIEWINDMCFRLFFGQNVKSGWYGLFREDDDDLEPQQYEFPKNSTISKI